MDDWHMGLSERRDAPGAAALAAYAVVGTLILAACGAAVSIRWLLGR